MKKSLLAFVIALAMGLGQAASVATASSNIDGEEIRAFDFGYSGAPQGDREAGPYSVVFTNIEKDPLGFHEIIFLRLGAGNQRAAKAQIIKQLDLAIAVLISGGNPVCATCSFDYIAGAAFAPPGTTVTSVGPTFAPGPVLLLRGRYAYFCAIPEQPSGTPHYKLGMLGTFWAK